ncbi:hypothetical protein [Kitasatospora sp. NPDC001095]
MSPWRCFSAAGARGRTGSDGADTGLLLAVAACVDHLVGEED